MRLTSHPIGSERHTLPEPVGADADHAPAPQIAVLFRKHHAELVRLAVLIVSDQPTAEDVVQDVFARLHARGSGAGRNGEELAYIRACVLNACRTALRRRLAYHRVRDTWWDATKPVESESAETQVIDAEGRRQVMAAIAALPRRRREVIVLRYYVGLSEAEISATLGVSKGTVKSAAARGMATLARMLGEESA